MNGNNPHDERGNDLEMTVCANGVVNVRNQQSGSGEAHTVMLADDGTAVRCSCKGYTHHGHCYHTNEVESRPLVVASASAAKASTPTVATDGGQGIDDRFRLPEDPEHVSEDVARDLSPCPGCSRLTQHETCGRDRCEGTEINETPL